MRQRAQNFSLYSHFILSIFLLVFLFSTGCTVVGSNFGGGGVVGGGGAPTVSIPAPVVTRMSVTFSDSGTVTVRGAPGATVGRYFVRGENKTRTGTSQNFLEKIFINTAYAANTAQVLSATDGSFTLTLDGNRGDVISIDQVDLLGNISSAVFIPTSLKIFVTAATFDGNLMVNGGGVTGIAGADNLCMSDSNYPGIGTYKAIISDDLTRIACTTPNCMVGGASENVNWVLDSNSTYIRSSDFIIIGTTTSAGIFTFNLTNSFTGAADIYWTGLASDWTGIGNTCMLWTSNGGIGEIGFGNSITSTSIDLASSACGTPAHLLCAEQ